MNKLMLIIEINKNFNFVLIIEAEKPPWILTRYRSPNNLRKGLTEPGLFANRDDVANLLSKVMGWLSWSQVREILIIIRQEFQTEVE